MHTLRAVAALSSLLIVAAPALAASDYLLQLDVPKVEGSDAAPPQTIEVESFSWGASNAAVTGSSAGAGKVNVQDLSMTKARAPRDVSTGVASGRRATPQAAAEAPPATAVAPPKVGDVATFTVVSREAPSASTDKSGACATGTHFPHAVIVAKGQRYELSDVVVTSCAVADGQTRKNYTGHVTLMK
jgi:hypothetical protein